uniref:Uncharacterized protein LOC108037313 n=1 Tax=Drosophila rhopaloa TaxID=1041015 RepID=A0A6P4DUV6_DRORH
MPPAVPPSSLAVTPAAPAASNLFETSGYPDPFNEPDSAVIPAEFIPAAEEPNKEELPQDLTVAGGTPTKNMLTPPKPSGGGGHRRNVSDTSAFNKTFANETSQFLAPFNNNLSAMGDGPQTLASAASNPGIYASATANSAVSISELMKPAQTAVEKRVEAWNPFEEEQPSAR